MRLDKYLQVTGLIKRRVLASEACRRGLVRVNGIAVKPTREVAAGDSIIITLARREIEVKVLQEIKGISLKKALRSEYFETVRDIAITPVSELDDFWAEDSKDD